MYFRSTMDGPGAPAQTAVSFREAVLRCLPPAGLYVPEAVPDLRSFFLHMGEETNYPELVSAITPLLFEGDLNPLSSSRVAENAFNFEPELVQLDDTFSVLKLYNGPTGGFKDFGINFLAALLEELLQDEGRAMVISAVRGTTGAAIARAFRGRKNIITTLLYPDEVLYGLERESYVPAGGNVIPIRVRGSLDDCQKLVGEVIRDRDFAERYRITSGNAINPGRLFPQSFYYLYSFIKLKKRLSGELMFSIPSGNFGNLIAALYAWEFGMPVNGYIAAMNVNNTFNSFDDGVPGYGTQPDRHNPDNCEGKKSPGAAGNEKPLISTISPALDVRYPSNYERLEAFYKSAPAVMRNMVYPKHIDDERTLLAMKKVRSRYGLQLDPYGALAFAAAEEMTAGDNFNGHIVVLSTAHPAHYADLVYRSSGERPVLPENLVSLTREALPIAEIEPDLEGLESAIAGCF